MELGAAVITGISEKGEIVEVEMPSDQIDIDAGYEEALASLRERKPIPSDASENKQDQEDYYKEIRTRLVLVWLIANVLLAMSLVHFFDYRFGKNAYLTFLLVMICISAVFRLTGSITYLIMEVVNFTSKHSSISA